MINSLTRIHFRRATRWVAAIIINLAFGESYAGIDSTSNYLITRYTDDNGLPQNSVKDIGRDSMGFIWLTTEMGVVRYDGDGRFNSFDMLNNTLKSSRMKLLTRDYETRRLWGLTSAGEMLLIKNGGVRLTDSSYWQLFAKSIPATHNALLDAGQLDYMVRLPAPDETYLPDELYLPNGSESGFTISADSVTYFEKDRYLSTVYYPHHNPWLFAVLNNQLVHFNGPTTYTLFQKGNTMTKYRINGDIEAIDNNVSFKVYWRPGSDQLFIYYGTDLYLISTDKGGGLRSKLVLSGFDFDINRIVCVHYLAEYDKLLLGSDTKGLFEIRRRQFTPIKTSKPFPRSSYYLQTLLPNGLLVSDEGKAFDETGDFKEVSALNNGYTQYSRSSGPGGLLWVLQQDSIFLYTNDARQLIKQLPNPTLAKVITRVDSTTYWIGGDLGIIMRSKDSDNFSVVTEVPYRVTYMVAGSGDTLYIGTDKGLIELNTTTAQWKEIRQFSGKFIRSIYQENGRIWVSTYQHGFFLYDNDKTTQFPLDKNGYLTASHCILEDAHGYFWISTNKGLFQIKKSQLLDYATDSSHVPFYFHYDKKDGLLTNEFNGGCQPCGIELPNGKFSFPSLDGLVWFDPLSVDTEFPSSKILLDEAKLDARFLKRSDTIQVMPDFSRLDINFVTPYYGHPNSLVMEYQISSQEKEPTTWLSFVDNNNTLSINQLSSGLHEIRVRMRNTADLDGYTVSSFYLFVEPTFFETTFFQILLMIFIGLTTWLVIAIRTKVILRQNTKLQARIQERTLALQRSYEWQQRIFASIVHDIKTPLNYVVQSLKSIHHIATQQNFKPGDLWRIYLSTSQIYVYSNNLANVAKATVSKGEITFSDTDLYLLGEQQKEIFNVIAEGRGNKILNRIPAGLYVESNSELLSAIIHNLVDNAIKFTRNGTITLDAEISSNGDVMFYVHDTGTGLNPQQIAHFNLTESVSENNYSALLSTGLGLILVKDIAKMIHVTPHITSEINQGTTIAICFHAVHLN